MAEKKRTYTTWMQMNVEDRMIVYLEGYVRENKEGNTVELREVQTNRGPKTVASVLVSVTIGDKRAESLLNYVNKDYGSYFVRVSVFGFAAERLRDYAPQKNQRLGFLGQLSVNEFEGQHGLIKNLNLVANDFKVCTGKQGNESSPARNDEKTEGKTKSSKTEKPSEPSSVPAADPAAFNPAEYGAGFANMDELMGDELPFD